MSKIKGKNTKPEMLVRKFLSSKGLRYRLDVKNLPGKPEIVLLKCNRISIINGCFWNGCENCKYFVLSKTRTKWRKEQNQKDRLNDVAKQTKLAAIEVKVIVV